MINIPSLQYQQNKRSVAKKSAIKNYGDIANQLLPQNNNFDPMSGQGNAKMFKLHDKKGSIPMSSLSS